MSRVEILVFLIAIWVPVALAYYIRRQFAAEYERYLAEREADREIYDQIMAGGTEVPPREGGTQ